MLGQKKEGAITPFISVLGAALTEFSPALNGSVATSSIAFRPWPSRVREAPALSQPNMHAPSSPAVARLAIARFRLQTDGNIDIRDNRIIQRAQTARVRGHRTKRI